MDQEMKQFIQEEIGSLARIVQGEFQTVRTEMQAMRTELKGDIASLDTKVNALDVKANTLDAKVTDLDEKVVELDVKVTRIDLRTQNQVDSVYEDVAELKKGQETTQKDIATLKAHVGLPA